MFQIVTWTKQTWLIHQCTAQGYTKTMGKSNNFSNFCSIFGARFETMQVLEIKTVSLKLIIKYSRDTVPLCGRIVQVRVQREGVRAQVHLRAGRVQGTRAPRPSGQSGRDSSPVSPQTNDKICNYKTLFSAEFSSMEYICSNHF